MVDAFVRVSLVGIELLTVDLRVVIASVDTYLRYAEGAERLQVYSRAGAKKLPNMVGEGVKSKGLQKGAEKVKEAFGGGDRDEDGEDEEKDEGEHKEGLAGALTHGVRHILKKGVGGILHNIKGDKGEEDDDERDEQREDDDGGEEREEQPRGRHGRDRDSKRATAGSRR